MIYLRMVVVMLSCLSPFPVGFTIYTIEWNDGSESTMALNFTFTIVAGQSIEVAEGFAVDGRFEGGTVIVSILDL